MQTYGVMVVADARPIMADEKTTIQIQNETWQRLNARKKGPNETFDDVIIRLLDEDSD